jgi:hypothetical protein
MHALVLTQILQDPPAPTIVSTTTPTKGHQHGQGNNHQTR